MIIYIILSVPPNDVYNVRFVNICKVYEDHLMGERENLMGERERGSMKIRSRLPKMFMKVGQPTYITSSTNKATIADFFFTNSNINFYFFFMKMML